MRRPAETSARGALAPENYAGYAIEQLYHGCQPNPPLTPAQERALLASGFIARREDENGRFLVLTSKGDDLAEDIAAERDYAQSHNTIRGGAL